MAEDVRKEELIAELEASRRRAVANFRAFRRDLDVPARAQHSFAQHPVAWIGGTSFIGLLVSRFLFRRKEPAVVVKKGKEPVVEKAEKAGLLLGILKLVFDLVRPALTTWATKFLTAYAAKKMGSMGKV